MYVASPMSPHPRVVGMLEAVYPSIDVLAEVGRVTISSSRLDLWMGFLWAHLDRNAEESKVRRESGAT
jgi:hypothetical protein